MSLRKQGDFTGKTFGDVFRQIIISETFWNQSRSLVTLKSAWAGRRSRLLFFFSASFVQMLLFEASYRAMRHRVFLSLLHSYPSGDKRLSASALQLVCLLEDPQQSLACADASEGKWRSSLTGFDCSFEVLALCSKPLFFRFRCRHLKVRQKKRFVLECRHQFGQEGTFLFTGYCSEAEPEDAHASVFDWLVLDMDECCLSSSLFYHMSLDF